MVPPDEFPKDKRAQQQNRNDKCQGSNRASRQDRYLRRPHNNENDPTVGSESVETVMVMHRVGKITCTDHAAYAGSFRDFAHALVFEAWARVPDKRRLRRADPGPSATVAAKPLNIVAAARRSYSWTPDRRSRKSARLSGVRSW